MVVEGVEARATTEEEETRCFGDAASLADGGDERRAAARGTTTAAALLLLLLLLLLRRRQTAAEAREDDTSVDCILFQKEIETKRKKWKGKGERLIFLLSSPSPLLCLSTPLFLSLLSLLLPPFPSHDSRALRRHLALPAGPHAPRPRPPRQGHARRRSDIDLRLGRARALVLVLPALKERKHVFFRFFIVVVLPSALSSVP